jgi:hypothetical protein
VACDQVVGDGSGELETKEDFAGEVLTPPDRSWLTILFVIFGTRWLLAGSAFQRGIRVAETTHFPGGLGIRLLCGIMAPVFLYGAGVVALSPTRKQDWWVFLVLLCLAGTCLWLWPEEIVISPTDVSQKRLFGLGTKRITWDDVDYIADDPIRGITVAAKDGLKIVHTKLHVGHEEFLAILKRHHRVF